MSEPRQNYEGKVSSCCGTDFAIEKEWDDGYPEKGRWVGVMRCLACGSVCEAIYPDDVEEDNFRDHEVEDEEKENSNLQSL